MAKATVTAVEDLPLVLTMRQVQGITGLSKPEVYKLPDRTGFPAIRFGRAIRVPRDAFLRWLETEAEGRRT